MTFTKKQICFLLGAPRSGTTWLQRLIQSSPYICGGEESHFFTLFAHPLRAADQMAMNEKRLVGPLAYISRTAYEQNLRNLWDGIFNEVYIREEQALIHLEKTPFNCLCINEIVRLFFFF